MEHPQDVDDIPATKLTRKNIRTLDTWKVHLQQWECNRLITMDEHFKVRMKNFRSMLNYSAGTRPKDRWLNDIVIVGYASIFETRWNKVIGVIQYQSFARTGQIPEGWKRKCSEMLTLEHILMPRNCGEHWMMADIRPMRIA